MTTKFPTEYATELLKIQQLREHRYWEKGMLWLLTHEYPNKTCAEVLQMLQDLDNQVNN